MKTFYYRYRNIMKIRVYRLSNKKIVTKDIVGKNRKSYVCLGVLFSTILNELITFLQQYSITITKLKNCSLSKISNLDLSSWPICKPRDENNC